MGRTLQRAAECPPPVAAFGRLLLLRVREFLAAPHSPSEFHAMRLEAKHLRYTLELFRPCYPVAAMDLRLDALKQLQDSLGALNDAVASRKLLGRSLNRQPKLRELSGPARGIPRRRIRQALEEDL